MGFSVLNQREVSNSGGSSGLNIGISICRGRERRIKGWP
jgi:hypothetical protein